MCFWFASLLSSPMYSLFMCVRLKKTKNFIFERIYTFSYRLRNIRDQQSYQVFLIDFIFFKLFCSNLSITSIDTIIGLKNSYFISFFLFTTLPFKSLSSSTIKCFSNSKKLLFEFKEIGTFSYFLSIFVFIVLVFHPCILRKKKKSKWF